MTNVQVYDFIILILIGALTLRGWMKGMVSQIASLAAIAASFWASARFSPMLEPMIQANPPWNKVLAITITFVGASIAVGIAHYCLAKMISAIRIKKYDKLSGAIFGAAKGIFIGMIITFFAVMLSEQTRVMALQSRSGKVLANLVQQVQVMLPKDVNELINANLEGFKKQMDSQTENSLTQLADTKTIADKAAGVQNFLGKLQDAWTTITKNSGDEKNSDEINPADIPPTLIPRSSNRFSDVSDDSNNLSDAADSDPLLPSILQNLSSAETAIKTTDLIPSDRFNHYAPTATNSTTSLTISSPFNVFSPIDSSLVTPPSAPRLPIPEQANSSSKTLDWEKLLKNLP
jgi:membrane protein required for colicin V production